MENFQQVKLEGTEYTWTGMGWYRSSDYTTPAAALVDRLNHELAAQLAAGGYWGVDVCTLVGLARKAADAGEHRRAEGFARQAVRLSPTDAGAAAVLACVLRGSGRYDEALAITEPFRAGCHPDLLTARAAILCDLGRYDEAETLVTRAKLMGNCGEASRLAHVIQEARGHMA